MFEENEWKQLVSQLIKLTRAETVDWKNERDEVAAVIGDYRYAIGSVDNDGRIPYYLAVKESWGQKELDRLESQPINEEPFAQPSAGEMLLELRHLAFRSAQGAPQLFSKLMADLQQAEEPPF